MDFTDKRASGSPRGERPQAITVLANATTPLKGEIF